MAAISHDVLLLLLPKVALAATALKSWDLRQQQPPEDQDLLVSSDELLMYAALLFVQLGFAGELPWA